MTENTKHRLRRFARGTVAVVVWWSAWYPADWLAGLVFPLEWHSGTLQGSAAEAWYRQWNRRWWLCYLIWIVLTLAFTWLTAVVRRRRETDPAVNPT